MPRLRLTRALAAQAHDVLEHDLPGTTVGEALETLFATEPALRRYLLDDNGRVRRHINLFVNDTLLLNRGALDTPIADADTIAVLQAVSGGEPAR